MRPAEFRQVYDEGVRVPGRLFAAFCLRRAEARGPRIGVTTPRSLGNAVARNRIRRRLKECVRTRLARFGSCWEVVFNPRRALIEAPLAELEREVEKICAKCAD